jgi:hypothetical protein
VNGVLSALGLGVIGAYRLESSHASLAGGDVVDDEAAFGLGGELIAEEESDIVNGEPGVRHTPP